jgi:hypothetical protein
MFDIPHQSLLLAIYCLFPVYCCAEAEYHVNWIVDNLPNAAAVNDMDEQTQTTFYDVGFPVG